MPSKNSDQFELSKKLNSQLLNFIKAVFTEQLNFSNGAYRLGYGPDWRDESELHPNVMEKFGIRIHFVDRQRSDSPITVLCVLTDKLGEIFKKYDFAPFLNVTLQDNGEDFFDFSDKDDVDVVVSCRPLFINNKNDSSYSDFVEAVSKELLFTTIKYS
jgi:hypothetical protein